MDFDFESLSASERRLRTDLSAMARKMPKGSRLEFDIEPGEMFLKVFMVPPSQRGCGSMWMSRLLEACDRACTPVRLNADPTDEPGDPDQFGLVRWYHSFGFIPRCATEDGVFMERPAAPARNFQKILSHRSHLRRLDFSEYERIIQVGNQPTVQTANTAPTRRPCMG